MTNKTQLLIFHLSRTKHGKPSLILIIHNTDTDTDIHVVDLCSIKNVYILDKAGIVDMFRNLCSEYKQHH